MAVEIGEEIYSELKSDKFQQLFGKQKKPKERRTKRPKYGNVKTRGYASKKEAARADLLKTRLLAGEISELIEQPTFIIIPKSEYGRDIRYTPDFSYIENGKQIAEDVKGSLQFSTSRDFPLRKRLFQERYGKEIELRIITGWMKDRA